MRVSFVLFFLFIGGLVLVGCTQLQASRLELEVTPSEGHPSVADDGFKVTVHCSGGSSGTYEIDFGDGTPVVTCNGYAEHLYSPPFEVNEYRVVAYCGNAHASRSVRIQNETPVFYGIYASQGGLLHQFEKLEPTELWVHYFVKGCQDCPEGACDPYEVRGAKDPDGDPLLFEWHIRPKGGAVEDAVFDRYGNRVNGIPTKDFLFIWFPTWRDPDPPFPFPPSGWDAGVEEMSIVFPSQPQAVIGPQQLSGDENYVLDVIVSDYWGAKMEYSTLWTVLVQTSSLLIHGL